MLDVSVEKITKVYPNGVTALEEVSFSYRGPGVLCLLGPNGAGKTTLISILATILQPSKGRAYVCGFDVVKEADKVRKHIVLVPQTPAADWIMSVRDNLKLFSMLYGDTSWGRAKEYIDLLGLKDKLGERVLHLSGGMIRKLQIIRALLSERDVYLLDEPTLELDYESTKKVLAIIRDISRSSLVVMATNNLHEAELVCDHVVLLNRRVIIDGSIEDVRRKIVPDIVIEIRIKPGIPHESLASKLSSKLEDLEGVKIGLAREFNMVVLRAPRSKKEELVQTITSLLQDVGIRITGVTVREASLEEVFARVFPGGGH